MEAHAHRRGDCSLRHCLLRGSGRKSSRYAAFIVGRERLEGRRIADAEFVVACRDSVSRSSREKARENQEQQQQQKLELESHPPLSLLRLCWHEWVELAFRSGDVGIEWS